MRTGIFGGTFNPIHLAHLRIAEEAREACGLDRVLFLPAALPPHKQSATDTPFKHRLAMVAAAVADHPGFIASDLEAQRTGASYSVDTLEALQQLYPDDSLYFIIGLDSFCDIASWKNYLSGIRGTVAHPRTQRRRRPAGPLRRTGHLQE